MKHRGPSSSLHPAREAARAQARAAAATQPRSTTGHGGPVAVGAWLLEQDPATGGLTARHLPTGAVTVLALPPQPSEGSTRDE